MSETPSMRTARHGQAGAAALVAAATLALGACGGSGKPTASPTQPPSSSASSSAASSASSTASSTPSASNVAPAGPAPCRASGLRASFLGQQGATGHGEVGFALRNVSPRSCHTIGFPGVLFLDRSGAPLPTDARRTTNDFFGTAPVASLILAPGRRASFRIGVTHGFTPGSSCATAYALQIIPPNDTATLRVAIPQGAYECRTATVSPLRPGGSAYP